MGVSAAIAGAAIAAVGTGVAIHNSNVAATSAKDLMYKQNQDAKNAALTLANNKANEEKSAAANIMRDRQIAAKNASIGAGGTALGVQAPSTSNYGGGRKTLLGE